MNRPVLASRSVSQFAPLMDKRVEIHGTSRADMNGKCGVATDFHWYEDKSKARYTVQRDSGEAFKLKPANVRAENGLHGAELYELALRVKMKISCEVEPSQTHSWPPLSPSQQEEMDGAIVMFQKAMDQVGGRAGGLRDSNDRACIVSAENSPHHTFDIHPQGHILAAHMLGDIYHWGQGVAIDYPRAMAAYKVAAEAGDAVSQHQLGMIRQRPRCRRVLRASTDLDRKGRVSRPS